MGCDMVFPGRTREGCLWLVMAILCVILAGSNALFVLGLDNALRSVMMSRMAPAEARLASLLFALMCQPVIALFFSLAKMRSSTVTYDGQKLTVCGLLRRHREVIPHGPCKADWRLRVAFVPGVHLPLFCATAGTCRLDVGQEELYVNFEARQHPDEQGDAITVLLKSLCGNQFDPSMVRK